MSEKEFHLNRLVRVEDESNVLAEYEYDGVKRRIVKKSYSVGMLDQIRHLYYTEPSKWQVIEERVTGSSDPERHFVWGLRYVDDLILRDRTTEGVLDERLYGLQDANWNVTGIADSVGAIQERYAYGAPFLLAPSFAHRVSSDFAWESCFAGYRYDMTIQVYHVRNRVLSAQLGRYLVMLQRSCSPW